MIGKITSIVLDARDIAGLAGFYRDLTGWQEVDADDDWITLADAEGFHYAFQLAPDHVPPRWPDPRYPQQFHLDLRVSDIDAAARRAQDLGAQRLGGGDSWHTLADPAGHPFDLCTGTGPATTLSAVMLDCPDPTALSRFYAELLGMRVRYDGDEGVLIGADGQPPVAFARVETLRAPRWPDPAYPQQYHLDIRVADIAQAEPPVLALGAAKLDHDENEGFRVYADPAGHPFCLVR